MIETTTEEILKAQSGNQEDMQHVIDKNVGLIWSIVRRFKDRGVDTEDLFQIGCMGFIKAIKRFDVSFNVKLSTYAVTVIMGEIKRFLRDDGIIKVSRSIKELASKINELKRQFYLQNKEEPNVQEITELLHISKEDAIIAMEVNRGVDSIYEQTDKESGATILDRISNQKDEETEIVNRITIKELVGKLKTQEKEIIFLRYYKEKTQTQVASILGISQVQVCRIEKKILSHMKEKIA